jgi:hypothetical protein
MAIKTTLTKSALSSNQFSRIRRYIARTGYAAVYYFPQAKQLIALYMGVERYSNSPRPYVSTKEASMQVEVVVPFVKK